MRQITNENFINSTAISLSHLPRHKKSDKNRKNMVFDVLTNLKKLYNNNIK